MGKYKIAQTLAPAPGMCWFEKEVDGEPVHFSGYEGFQFFSHSEMDTSKWGDFEMFFITEVVSGCMIGKGLSVEDAMATALKNLSGDTTEGLQERINEVLQLKNQIHGN